MAWMAMKPVVSVGKNPVNSSIEDSVGSYNFSVFVDLPRMMTLPLYSLTLTVPLTLFWDVLTLWGEVGTVIYQSGVVWCDE